MGNPATRLSATELDRYRDEGYIVRERVFDPTELGMICDACEQLVEGLVRHRRGERQTFGSYTFDADLDNSVIIKWEGDTDIVHGIEPFAHLSKDLSDWAYDARLIDPMRDILGIDQPELFTEKLNLKRPRHGGANPLHQDYPYWIRVAERPDEIATAMLFLDDSNLANGCLHVAPGSHRGDVFRGRSDGDRFAANEIDRALYEALETVPVEVPAGSIVMFGPMLVHKSAPNLSETNRRALLYSYQPPGLRTQLQALRMRSA
jgi:hypothetical protein